MQFHDDQTKRRYRTFDGPQRDPTARHKAKGIPYFRKGHDRVLMPDDFMPVGTHAGKHLRAVPVDYLLWVDAQPWSKHWGPWEPVHDYMTRFILDSQDTDGARAPTTPIIFVDGCVIRPNASGPFVEGSSCLHTLPGHEDCLHAFAVGALKLRSEWYLYQGVSFPHYPLTTRKHDLALQCGAVEIDRTTVADHTATWHQYFATKRLPIAEDRADGTESRACFKHGYPSKRAAETAANFRKQGKDRHGPDRGQKHNRPDYLRAYHCPDCNLWHLTHKPARNRP